MEKIVFDKKERFMIKDYGKKSAFSSFLPGISGKLGIPMWCHYVNRGQCITSFGIEDKNHSIMEFFPAYQSYSNTKRLGFRTFVKKDGRFFEFFSDEKKEMNLYIGMNEFEIENVDTENGLKANVLYYTLPEEPAAGLIRQLTIENISNETCKLEIMDGMPALIPSGVSLDAIKNMAQTSMAWMQVEEVEERSPFFAVRVSMEDTAAVKKISGGYYYFTVDETGTLLPVVVDPTNIFDYDTTFEKPICFMENDLEQVLGNHQVTQNKLPCCFTGKEIELAPNGTCILYSMVGETASKNRKDALIEKAKNIEFFKEKHQRSNEIISDLCKVIDTKTGNKIFDGYCKQTFLDNVLRGGYPMVLGGNKIFYLYSRKHGDIERDYNFFRMLPEYYSQGNGNYRDVNQNRRSDVLFAPFVKDENIKLFYSLIQIDGYNPLSVEMKAYYVKKENLKGLLELISEGDKEELERILLKGFTPGQLLQMVETYKFTEEISIEEYLEKVIGCAEYEVNSQFGEGYWTDHWTYNLDLIEGYLSVYPEKEENLLFDDSTYDYFESQARVLPRNKRYVKTENGIRQYHSTERKKENKNTRLKSNFGTGEKVTSNLMEKLLLLCVTKYSALDPFGIGVEMEGGKPGWYDALNGLPGIFGSSVAESCELLRMLEYTKKAIISYGRDVELLKEVAGFLKDVSLITEKEDEKFILWDKINDRKEAYREKVKDGVSGEKEILLAGEIEKILSLYEARVKDGLKRALEYGNGICPTYFSYQVTKFEEQEEGIKVLEFKPVMLPFFLEGPVRFLKLKNKKEEKETLYQKIKKSDLYDTVLKMYKVNAPIQDASFELGRAKAFTPGWLENESIWLHMEYKYLLELLKNEMYEEFKEDFKNAAVPFLDPEVYGRSILENSSFIASSANPDKRIHGKGFVARLSGSTAEFLQMWQILMFGKNPFKTEGNQLIMEFNPCLLDYMIGEEDIIEARFLGTIPVTYQLNGKKEIIPGKTKIEKYIITAMDGAEDTILGERVSGELAQKVRAGTIAKINVFF